MKTIIRRLQAIEDRVSPRRPVHLVVIRRAESEGLVDTKLCLRALGECGFVPTNTGGVVNLLDVPDNLNPKELERYLRENGAQIRNCIT